MTADTLGHQRRAALALHALERADREWLLDRLEPVQRRSVEGMLVELDELRIPPDRQLLQRALAAPRPAAPGATARSRLDALSVERVHALLRDEPAGLVARLLAAHRWSWTEALIQCFDAPMRRRLGEAAREAAPDAGSGELEQWLVEDLARRGSDPAFTPAPAAPTSVRNGKRRSR